VDRSKKANDYDGIIDSLNARHSTTNEKQPGDPASAVQRIIDAVCNSGCYSMFSELPLRVVLGSDAVAVMRNKCNTTLLELNQFENVAKSTDFEYSACSQVEEYI
jgi:hypothetical protein